MEFLETKNATSLGDIQLEQKKICCMLFWLDLYQYFKSFLLLWNTGLVSWQWFMY